MKYLSLVAPTELGKDFKVCYLTATSANCSNAAKFMTTILEQIDYPTPTISNSRLGLNLLFNVLKSLRSKHQTLVICIDEFEGFNNQPEFHSDFFTKLGTMAETESNLGLVIASRHPLNEIVEADNKISAFFSIFYPLELRPFSFKEAEEFILEKSKYAGFTDYEQTRLIEFGKQWPPLRLQLACDMLLKDKIWEAGDGLYSYGTDDTKYWQLFESRLNKAYQDIVPKR